MNDTLSICIHGTPVKFHSCHLCHVEKRTADNYVSLSERIHKLEEHNNLQIDENRKIDRRFDEVEETIGHHCILINAHEDYLKKISGIGVVDPDKLNSNMKVFNEKIDELGENIKMLSRELFSFKNSYTILIDKMVEENIDAVWRKIKFLEDKIDDLAKNFDDNRVIIHKEPYKCPVCNGEGGYYVSGTQDTLCNPCAGKGIVWS